MLLAFLSVALAATPLDLAVDVAEADLQAWWRPGELLVGVPARGDRTALRPLVDLNPTTLPADLTGWTELGASCSTPARGELVVGGQTVSARVAGPPEQRVLLLEVGEELRAQQSLGRPLRPCSVHLGQADALPGIEVMVSWEFGEGAAATRGLSVFRVPEALVSPSPPAGPAPSTEALPAE